MAYFQNGRLISEYTNKDLSAGTEITLQVSDSENVVFEGTNASQVNVTFPNATNLILNFYYKLINDSDQDLQLKYNDGTNFEVLRARNSKTYFFTTVGTQNGVLSSFQNDIELYQGNTFIKSVEQLSFDDRFFIGGSSGQQGTLNFQTKNTSTATSNDGNLAVVAGTTNPIIYLTGTGTNYTVTLPNATSLTAGLTYDIYNVSSEPVVVRYNDTTTLLTVNANATAKVVLQVAGTQNGTWSIWSLETGKASGIKNSTLTSNTLFQTTSLTDVIITGFTVTPEAGQYAIIFDSSFSNTTNNSENIVSLYKNTTQLTNTERTVKATGSDYTAILTTQAVENFNGTDTLSVYVRVTGGTISITERSIIAIRLGNQTA
jgi:hypothetical protein